ncbi:hypothetical protein AWH62_14030 [Maricaulis sp. W15]|uniref:CheY-like chemotaxis protein n=1 Tax=Maricaulis maris TaxID=74318 RepID=A0A495DDR0_9PROT|nr:MULTISPECIES: response regulator [Maricaulis]OLF80834.1 hypothetical protein AWH62_14030 [Maricaulis sp. W15]RKR00420.1 CheY-like chemotaxis protein [Maricaulis maris]
MPHPGDAFPDPDILAADSRFASLHNLRLLLVEDNLINREVARAFLKPLQLDIREAETGLQALECLQSGAFDAILMDVRMPVMDGLDATRRIRASTAAWRDIPVVAMTGNVSAAEIDECHDAGMDTHLAKPFRPDALFAALLEARQRRPYPAAGHGS